MDETLCADLSAELLFFLNLCSASHPGFVQVLSTGGTAKALRDAGLDVKDVSDYTLHPEMMDGRVKTLHPKVHGGLLSIRNNAVHDKACADHGIQHIDMVCVNLYPFQATVAKGAAFPECVENIDIGGPAMIRSGSKNHESVTVLTDPAQYARVIAEMKANDGATTLKTRRSLAAAAYAKTAAYDSAIANWFAAEVVFFSCCAWAILPRPEIIIINAEQFNPQRFFGAVDAKGFL